MCERPYWATQLDKIKNLHSLDSIDTESLSTPWAVDLGPFKPGR